MALITLTTDFGEGSAYVAAMKGVILRINPEARVIDVTHAIPPQNIEKAAFVLWQTYRWFPAGTIHVVVVDPGVGTARPIVVVQLAEQLFVGPDNGVFTLVTQEQSPDLAIYVEEPRFWLPQVSSTFHGRDIMAPIAARLSLGTNPHDLGRPCSKLVEIPWEWAKQSDRAVCGRVVDVDSFGNLITNIRAGDLPDKVSAEQLRIQIANTEIRGISPTYASRSEGEIIALVGSSGLLEIAVVNGSAATKLGVSLGHEVSVHW